MDYKNIIFSQDENVACIKLNRPDALNSFTMPMAKELQNALDKVMQSKNIRALVLTGSGRAFCAGQDLSEAIEENGPQIKDIVQQTYNPIIKKLFELPKPVICAVNGVAAGAGANIAFACDITLAHTDAKFIQSFASIGLIPDSGGTYSLPRLVGRQKAMALTMLAEKISGDDAAKMGLIYKVATGDVLEEAMAIAKKLSTMPTVGLGLTKRAINKSDSNTLQQQLELEAELQGKAAGTYDFKEGVAAFLEKRKPAFKGE